mmetsp:Transcript_5503/g.16812  ORF Transcript_5503/g.16812 Transcript_5503/m.16812 type:complete len:80 (-) Transcript_5503:146-385(-)
MRGVFNVGAWDTLSGRQSGCCKAPVAEAVLEENDGAAVADDPLCRRTLIGAVLMLQVSLCIDVELRALESQLSVEQINW